MTIRPKLIFFIFYLLLQATLSIQVFSTELKIFTEEFPPFNFTEKEKITGVSTEIVKHILEESKLKYTIKSYPWARSYKSAQSQKNSLIYSIGRNAEREHLFKWVGILLPAKQSIFTLKDRTDIKVEKIEDIKKFIVGTTAHDSRETYLISKGFEEKNFNRKFGEKAYIKNYKLLKATKIDLWPMSNAVANYISKSMGDRPDQVLQKIYELEEISKGGYYLASGLNTSDSILKVLRKNLESFKKSSKYKKILTKWGIGN